ncbi:HIT domain-containing protein [Vibrio viridaestus]|uniref:HIT domain-containing protein n=1 Tax=Vibrio viridaestus TaxID=2487322 RepID=A0A3N9TIN1_9VIBR|nr:HIT family protein [Vibrio viridaestus]RQW64147.1 HIT domain-containing protein [Vibrio viridaestus]
MPFQLHPRLAADTSIIGEFPLSLVLLHRDSAVPWIILVPKKQDLLEFHHLSIEEQHQFLRESQVISELLENEFHADKINLGALGNLVPQLHYHHIARYKTDIAWPGPVWGNTPGDFRAEDEQLELQHRITKSLEQFADFQAQ